MLIDVGCMRFIERVRRLISVFFGYYTIPARLLSFAPLCGISSWLLTYRLHCIYDMQHSKDYSYFH